MKLKLDENLGNDARGMLEGAGHDVSTVPQQHLQAALDDDLIFLALLIDASHECCADAYVAEEARRNLNQGAGSPPGTGRFPCTDACRGCASGPGSPRGCAGRL